jgi:hypothetical protein
MSSSLLATVGPRATSGSSGDRRKKRPTKAPRSLLTPPRDDEDEEDLLEAAPPVYASEVQMYVEIERMVVTLFRSFELSPLV